MTIQTDKSTSYTTPGMPGLVSDWSSDKQNFDVPWGKLMMWIFLLSDTFIFSIFLTSYMTVRLSATDAWPNASEVFALEMFGHHLPLILIAITAGGHIAEDHRDRRASCPRYCRSQP